MLSWNCISPALTHLDQTFKKNFIKKYKFGWKKSPHSEKSQKNVNLDNKNSQTNVKRHKNVNLI